MSKIPKKAAINNSEVLEVQGVEIHLLKKEDEDYISLTDMTKNFEGGGGLIDSWLRNKNTIEFLGVWERLNNPSFNSLEFEGIKTQAGLNRFSMSAKSWMTKVNGISVIAKTGRYGGTFAHKDIALEFASWLSPEFKLYIIKEFQRFKEIEAKTNNLEWSVRRMLVKAQYKTHTDAVKTHLIPPEIPKDKHGAIYASEADILNVVIFGKTAKAWKIENPMLEGNPRDHASIEQLIVLSSLESQNAILIQLGMNQAKRMALLSDLAKRQMKSLLANTSAQKLFNQSLLDS